MGKNGPLPLEVTNFLFDGDDKMERLEQHGRNAAMGGPAVADKEGQDLTPAEKAETEEERVETVRPTH